MRAVPRLVGAGLVLVSALSACDPWICPPFLRSHRRSRSAECKANLKALYMAERALFHEEERYSERVADLGFLPERGNRYAYYLSVGGPLSDRKGTSATLRPEARGIGVDLLKYGSSAELRPAHLPASLAGGVTVGVVGECPRCEFVAACVGNIDEDPALDILSIASFDRVDGDGTRIPGGIPHQEADDREL